MKYDGIEEGVRDLRDRTKELALRVVKLYSDLPKSTEAQVIGKQVLRSGTSVGTGKKMERMNYELRTFSFSL